MSAIGIRRSGIEVKCQIPSGKVNDTYVDIFEIELMSAGLTGTDGQTLQQFAGNSGDDTEVWNALVTAGKSVTKVTKRNIQLITTQIAGVTENQGKFVGENIAEVTAMSRIGKFIILSTNAYSIFWNGNDGTPAYDDASGTALTPLVGFGFYFVRVKNVGLEDTGLPSGWKYSKLISFDDFYPTDFAGLRHFAFVRNVSGTLYFRDQSGNNITGGSIIIEEGRKLWSLSAENPTGNTLGGLSGITSSSQIMFAIAGKSFGSTPIRLNYDFNYATYGIDIRPNKITKANLTDLISLNETSTYWTVSGDGFFISIIIIGINGGGTVTGGGLGIKWSKGGSDANALVTAGVKAYTNKNGALQLQTLGAGLSATNDATADYGIDGNGKYRAASSTGKTSCVMVATKASFSDTEIQNVFDFLKRMVTP